MEHVDIPELQDKTENPEKPEKMVLGELLEKTEHQELPDYKEQGESEEYPVTWAPEGHKVLKVNPVLLEEMERKESPDNPDRPVCLDYPVPMESLELMECLVPTVNKDHAERKDQKDPMAIPDTAVLRDTRDFPESLDL